MFSKITMLTIGLGLATTAMIGANIATQPTAPEPSDSFGPCITVMLENEPKYTAQRGDCTEAPPVVPDKKYTVCDGWAKNSFDSLKAQAVADKNENDIEFFDGYFNSPEMVIALINIFDADCNYLEIPAGLTLINAETHEVFVPEIAVENAWFSGLPKGKYTASVEGEVLSHPDSLKIVIGGEGRFSAAMGGFTNSTGLVLK